MRASHGATGGLGLAERGQDPANCRIEDSVALFSQQMDRWPTPGTEERSENPETFAARRAKIDPAKRMGPNGTLGMAAQSFHLPASAWPTPAARDFKGVDRQEIDRGNARPLNEVAANWSTPRASDGEKGGPNQSFGAGGVPLVAQATSWSTPSVADTTGGRKARSGDRSGEMLNNSLAPLVADIATWATPRVEMSRAPGNAKHISGNRGKGFIEDQVVAWRAPPSDLQALETPAHGGSSPTPSPTFYRRYRATTDSALRCEMRALRRIARDRCHIAKFKKDDAGRWESVLTGGSRRIQASTFTRPAFRRQLNPRFVEWLMSWPPGLTSFDCSETALLTHKAAWRSELASMTSLPAGPPAQLSLFG